MINLKDANGNYVVIKEDDLFKVLSEGGFRIYGMTLGQIIKMKRFAIEHGYQPNKGSE